MSIFRAGLTLTLSDKLSGPLASVERRYNRFGRSALENAERLDRAGQGMARLGVRTMAVGAALAAPLVGGVKAFATFDAAMTKSTSIIDGLTESQERQMKAAALQAAGTFSADQLAESYFFLASAGLDVEQQIGALPRVSAFAKAGQFDLAQATDLLTDAQSALGLATKDAAQNQANMARVSDVLVRANTMANASVEQFASSLTNGVGAALRAMGKDVEEGVGALAVLADQGLKGEAAGTALTGVLTMLPKVATKNAEAFKRYGVEVFDANGRMRALPEIADSMTAAFAGMSDAERAAAMEDMKLNRQLGDTVTQLLGTGDAMRAYTGGLYEASGATDAVAEKQGRGLLPTLTRLKNRLGVFGITLVQKYSGPLQAAAAWTERFVNRLIAWTERHPRLTTALVTTAAATSALLIVVGGGLTVLGLFARGIAGGVRALVGLRAGLAVARGRYLRALVAARQFGVAQGAASAASMRGAGALRIMATAIRAAGVAMMTNPIGIAVGVLAVAAFAIWRQWKPISAWFSGFFAGLRKGVEPLRPVFASLAAELSPLIDVAQRVWSAVGGFFGNLFRQADPGAEKLGEVASAGERVGLAVGSALTWIVGAARTAMPWIKRVFNVTPIGLFVRAIRAAPEAFAALKAGLARAREMVTSFSLADAGRRLIRSLIRGIKSMASSLVSSVKATFAPIRRLLPSSPVREGPLTAFNEGGSRLMRLMASTITPDPLRRALGGAFSAVRVPALAAGLAASGGAVGSAGVAPIQIEVVDNRTITISGGGADVAGAVRQALDEDRARLLDDVERALALRQRREF